MTIGASRDYWRPGLALPPVIAIQRLDSRLPYHKGHELLQMGSDLVQLPTYTGLANHMLN